ncbi:hypothetical protein HPB49_008119 [Dermacentor silvarum]|uniref:Uncharacterized protein n=1 Tax=Dermacentor silvarum TaxID=543639 RepID=A0ACB8CJZ9_DERSI|nr:hypothetical protein HPB49_008119 [Dermacentor silvarum]
MAKYNAQVPATPSACSVLTVWQWNCRSVRKKRESLIQYLQTRISPPDVIFLQELRTLPSLPGYVVYATHKDPNRDHLVATLVRRVHVVVDFTLDNQDIPHFLLELVPSNTHKPNTQPLRLLNVYSRPKERHARFDTLFQVAQCKGRATLIAGDLNAPHTTWGYPHDTPKGRNALHTLIQQHNLTLLTDPSV